jgi:hypothetical protein
LCELSLLPSLPPFLFSPPASATNPPPGGNSEDDFQRVLQQSILEQTHKPSNSGSSSSTSGFVVFHPSCLSASLLTFFSCLQYGPRCWCCWFGCRITGSSPGLCSR